jgi:branched-chain amino acid transport system permease protein
MVIGAVNLMKTRVGRSFVAIRDSDIAAEVMGVNLIVYKTLSFAVSAFYAGVAGGLFGFILGFFNPEPFNLILSIVFLVMVVVGGLGSTFGSIAGAALITWLQYDLLKNIQEMPLAGPFLLDSLEPLVHRRRPGKFQQHHPRSRHDRHRPLRAPGMFGVWIRVKKYWRTWPF